MLKITDLKKNGLYLSQLDAQSIHSKINGISQGHIHDGIVFPGEDKVENTKPDDNSPSLQQVIDELTKANFTLSDKLKLADEGWKERSEMIVQKNQVLAAVTGYLATIENPSQLEIDLIGQVNAAFDNEEGISTIVNNDEKPSFQLPVAGEHHATKKKRQKESGLQDHILTQEDLDNNQDLVVHGLKVGDLIEIPVE